MPCPFPTQYAGMLFELQASAQNALSLEQEIIGGFRVADRYWKALQGQIINYRFPSPEEEILFFKTCKPRFTAEIHYYNLCYCALLFQPDEPPALRRFWCAEKGRLQRFIALNGAFYGYLKEGRTDKDAEYFLRSNRRWQNSEKINVYDDDPRALTSKDPLVASLLALEKYSRFAQVQLQQLEQER